MGRPCRLLADGQNRRAVSRTLIPRGLYALICLRLARRKLPRLTGKQVDFGHAIPDTRAPWNRFVKKWSANIPMEGTLLTAGKSVNGNSSNRSGGEDGLVPLDVIIC